MPAEAKAKKKTREDLYKAFEEMAQQAMRHDIPIPQRQALLNRAQELRAQWVELEAARFNTNTEEFKKTEGRLTEAIADLRHANREVNDMVKIAEKATKVFGLIDKLLKKAVTFLPI